MTPLFQSIDTVIIRVADQEAATAWYAANLGLQAVYVDPDERLAVLPLPGGMSLTLWERKAGDDAPNPSAQGTYPIFSTQDAAAARETLKARNVRVDDLIEAPGVRYFTFHDFDGNRLEACQVLGDQ